MLPDPLPERLLFISAGSGITPIMSMLRALERRDALGDVVHLHSARTPDDVIFGEQLRGMRRAHRRLPPPRAAHRRDGPDRARATSTRCARTGASARPSSPARPSCSTPSTSTGSARATPSACTWSASSRSSARGAEDGEGGTIRFRVTASRRTRDGGDADPRRRRGGGRDAALRLPDGHLPHLRRAPAAPGRSATCAPGEVSRRARRDGPHLRQRPRGRRRDRTLNRRPEDHHGHEIESPLHRLTARADRGDRRGVRRDPRRGLRRPRRPRPPLHPQR